MEEEEKTFRVRDLRGQPKEERREEPQKVQEPRSKPRPANPSEESINFSSFLMSLSSSALMHMGLIENPATGKKEANPNVAKQEIDLIGMLEEKTRGNLDPREQSLMTEALYELRLRFVELTRKKP